MEKYTTHVNDADYVTRLDFEQFFRVAVSSETGDQFQNINKTLYINTDNLPPKYYTTYNTRGGEHWPVLAARLLGNVKLWWLLCKFNGVMDPTQPITPGNIIKVPTPEIVTYVLNTLKATK